jgi:hypothetical protein
MPVQNDLRLIQDIIRLLDNNPVARFSYTQDAFDNNEVDGVEVFDKDAGQNIPKADKTDYNQVITNKGIRGQGASIPRMGWNHYVGRPSFNLNKLVQKFLAFLGIYRAALAHNASEYDSSASYRTGDICYTVETDGSVKVYTWHQRISVSPETVSSIPPSVPAHWAVMQEKTSYNSLLPFSAPGYRHRFTVADLTGETFDRGKWYPVTTEARRSGAVAENDTPQILIEAFCNGQVAGYSAPHRAEFAVLSKFTGFPASSTDILLNNSFVDQIDGTVRPLTDGPIGYSKLPHEKQAVLWLRGGSRYALWNSFGSDFTLHTAEYGNGWDDPIGVSGVRLFEITPGVFKARVKSVEAVEADDAVIKGQADGALSMPKTLGAGAQLGSVRTPGSYVVTEGIIANSIRQTPVENPGPFDLVVRGDKAGLSVTVQQFTARETGEEFTRVLAGETVLVPWYLSGSPNGLEVVGFDGLYAFDIDDETGRLLVYYDGRDEPSFEIDFRSGHLIWRAPEDSDRTLDLGKVVGAGISGIAVTYQTGDSGTAAPDGTWSSSVPASRQGKYLWTKIAVTLLDGGETSVITGYGVSYYGKDGTKVTTAVTYQIGDSGTAVPDGTWSASPPTPQQGKYLWTKTVMMRQEYDGAGSATTGYGVSYYGIDAPAMSFEIDSDEESLTHGHLLLTLS